MANIYSKMSDKEKDNERKYLNNLKSSGSDGEKAWASSQLKQLDSASSTNKSSGGSGGTKSSGSSNRYKTTVTESNGTTSSGYIEDGRSYYDDGREINAGASVIDAQGKVWTKGGSANNTNTVDMINAAIYQNTYGNCHFQTQESFCQLLPAGLRMCSRNIRRMLRRFLLHFP